MVPAEAAGVEGGGAPVLEAESEPGERRLSRTAAVGGLGLGLAIVYLPLWLGQVLFYRDVGCWLYPARVFLHRSFAAGQSLLYNPYEGLGLPLAASPLYGLFYPGSWIPAWHSEARALSMGLFLHLIWGGVGMLLLARRFGLRWEAALVAAFGWALSGPVTAAGSAGQLLAAASWFPWCGLGAIALARRLVGPRSGLLAGIALAALPGAASILLGEVFQAALAMLFGAVTALVWSWTRLGRQVLPRAALAVPAAVILTGLLAAPNLAPLSAALGETERSAGLTRLVAEQWSLHPLRLTEMVAPQAMGDPYAHYPGGHWAGDGASDDRPLIYSVYLGIVPLLLALLGLRAGPRAARLGLGLLALLALLLALGRHTPVHAAFRALMPLFAFQRAPEKYVLLLVPPLALLAAFGVARALAAPRSLLLAALGLALPLAVLASLPLWIAAPVTVTISAGARQALAMIGALAGSAYLLLRRPGAAAAMRVVLPAVCFLDLALAASPLLVFAPAAMMDNRPAAAELIHQHRGTDPIPPRVARDPTVEKRLNKLVRQGDIVRHEALRYATLRASFLTAHGLGNVPGYDAGLPPALEALWVAGQSRALALMRLLSVDYVVLPFAGESAPPVPGLQLVGMAGPPGVAVYQVTQRRPRVYVSEKTQWQPPSASGADAPARLIDLAARGERIDLIEGPPPPSTEEPPSPGERESSCRLVSLDHIRVQARCTLAHPAQVIFVEQYGAGWTATVDGKPAPIRRANLVMRAVPVPAGDRQVVLSYTPPRLRLGLTAASIGLAFVLLALSTSAIAGMRARHGQRDRGGSTPPHPPPQTASTSPRGER